MLLCKKPERKVGISHQKKTLKLYLFCRNKTLVYIVVVWFAHVEETLCFIKLYLEKIQIYIMTSFRSAAHSHRSRAVRIHPVLVLNPVCSLNMELHSPESSASGEAGLGLARLALTLAWSTASRRFLESRARVWAAVNIWRWHSSFREVTLFCWARRILLIRSPRSLFSSFFVPSIWAEHMKQFHLGNLGGF